MIIGKRVIRFLKFSWRPPEMLPRRRSATAPDYSAAVMRSKDFDVLSRADYEWSNTVYLILIFGSLLITRLLAFTHGFGIVKNSPTWERIQKDGCTTRDPLGIHSGSTRDPVTSTY